jgi:RNA-directed DNA polymerase
MNLRNDTRQNLQRALDFSCARAGETRPVDGEETESTRTRNEAENPVNTKQLMEEVCERENLKEALRRVRTNKGSAGIDRMTVDGLPRFLKEHWPTIREQLLEGTYQPQPVLRVEIPKPDGGVRKLGIATVLDRFVQQASSLR